MTRILVIEDDPNLARGLIDNLRFEGHDPTHVEDVESALLVLGKDDHPLVLLDLMLPGGSGFDVLREIARSRSKRRVIVVSARDAETDIVRALDLGAHDYVRKPFGLAELLARIKAQIREVEETRGEVDNDVRTFDDVRVSFARFRLSKGSTEHLLSHTERELLRMFLDFPDVPLRRADILARVWGEDVYPTERTVDNFILRLRKKIEVDPTSPRHIVTVHGVGYRFVP